MQKFDNSKNNKLNYIKVKKYPWYNFMRQGPSRDAVKFVSCWPSAAGYGAYPKSGLFPQERKPIFHLQMAIDFVLGVRGYVYSFHL